LDTVLVRMSERKPKAPVGFIFILGIGSTLDEICCISGNVPLAGVGMIIGGGYNKYNNTGGGGGGATVRF
jgi:hypothetical protein